MSRILFAGPSIHGLGLESTDDFVVAPPAACGDILKAVRAGYRMIGLVDGLFAGERSVWHKEILFALRQGVRVLGAASMGALRAAECARFGMEGVGRIYRDYRDGRRTDDADVALQHAPAALAFQPLTVALVDAEASIAALLARGRISTQQSLALLGAARRLHFKQRTWVSIERAADVALARCGEAAAFVVEQKKADAMELIERMRAPSRHQCVHPTWTLNETLYLYALEEGLS